MQARPPPLLRVGIVPMPAFTMLALAGFVDTLRLAADEGDRSRPLAIRWTVLSEGRAPVRASNGIVVRTDAAFGDPGAFDYVVVVGGTLHGGAHETAGLASFLHSAADHGVPLVGLCTGSLTLARVGLMDGHVACVNWFHHDDYRAEFPRHAVVSDRLFVDDGARITCAGGISVVDVATHLIERHLGTGAGDKGRRIMIEEVARDGTAPQPSPPGIVLPPDADVRVRRALLCIDRRLTEPLSLAMLARAAHSTPRTLTRLFGATLGTTPAGMVRRLRLERAQRLLDSGTLTLAQVAAECGFSDAPHFARRYRQAYGRSPRQSR